MALADARLTLNSSHQHTATGTGLVYNNLSIGHSPGCRCPGLWVAWANAAGIKLHLGKQLADRLVVLASIKRVPALVVMVEDV